MPRNVEIKAHVPNMALLCANAEKIATSGPVDMFQVDTFFRCDTGRLKLRKFASDRGELIFYRRADKAGPKESFYLRSETSDPDTLRHSLELAYGISGQVTKHRVLYLVGRTRVHLDRVEGLGEFMELEVVLSESDSAEDGEAEAHELMKQLGVAPSQLVDGAYVDLLV